MLVESQCPILLKLSLCLGVGRGVGGGGGAVWNVFSMSVGEFSSLCLQVSFVC